MWSWINCYEYPVAPLEMVPVVPRNHSIFQKCLRNHSISLRCLRNHQFFFEIWLAKKSGTPQFKFQPEPLIPNWFISGDYNLKILYNARGTEIQKLRQKKADLVAQYAAEIRNLKHRNTLLKSDVERIKLDQVWHQKNYV